MEVAGDTFAGEFKAGTVAIGEVIGLIFRDGIDQGQLHIAACVDLQIGGFAQNPRDGAIVDALVLYGEHKGVGGVVLITVVDVLHFHGGSCGVQENLLGRGGHFHSLSHFHIVVGTIFQLAVRHIEGGNGIAILDVHPLGHRQGLEGDLAVIVGIDKVTAVHRVQVVQGDITAVLIAHIQHQLARGTAIIRWGNQLGGAQGEVQGVAHPSEDAGFVDVVWPIGATGGLCRHHGASQIDRIHHRWDFIHGETHVGGVQRADGAHGHGIASQINHGTLHRGVPSFCSLLA